MASRNLRTALLISLLAMLAHLRSLGNGFAFDDIMNVVENPLIRSWEGIFDGFGTPMFPGNLYRPMTLFSFGLTYQIFGGVPLPYHLANVVLHGIVSAFVFLASTRVTDAKRAAAAAVLFAVLPIHGEAVDNVTGRAELLAAAFGLASLLLTGPGISVIRSVASGGLFLAACLSKESAAMWLIPIAWLNVKSSRTSVAAAVAAVVVYATFRWNALHGNILTTAATDPLDNPLVTLDTPMRLLWAAGLLARYLQITLVPFPIGADYSLGYLTPGRDFAWIAGYIVAAAACTIWAIRDDRVRLGLAWFLIAFLPTSNLAFPIGTAFGDRLAYTPSIGIVLAISAIATTRRSILPVMATVYLSVCWWNSPIWRSNESLFAHQSIVSPDSIKTRFNNAIIARNHGRYEDAQVEMLAVLEQYPGFADAAYGIATIYLQKGIPSGGERWLHTALKLNADHLPAIQMLGRVYANSGRTEAAERKFRRALELNPHCVDAQIGLYSLFISTGRLEEADAIQSVLEREASGNPEFEQLRTKRMEEIR